VISRRKPPFEAGVLSFGKLEALGATNIIPDEVKIAGTFRAMNEDFRLKSHTLIKQIAEETAQASGAFCEVNILIGYPFLHNDESLTEQSKQRAKVFNDHIQVLDVPPRMGAEDFAYYSQKVPACFIRIGTGNEDKGSTNGLHSPNFNVDDEALLHGAGLLAWLAINQ
jgi:metal-dependent amidase/aminoacylase/carboxypeptidase family protein